MEKTKSKCPLDNQLRRFPEMNTVSKEYVIKEVINLINEYYSNHPSKKATIWLNDSNQADSFQLRHDRILKLYNRRSKSVEKKLADGDIPFPSSKYFVGVNDNQYKIPSVISRGISQLLASEYITRDKTTYPSFITFCVDNLTRLYENTHQSVNKNNFLVANLEVLIGASSDTCLIIYPQTFFSTREADTYDEIFNLYPIQRNHFLIRLSIYHYMNILPFTTGIRSFKQKYYQISNILRSNFSKDYSLFINSKPISIPSSDFIYRETDIALNQDAYLGKTDNNDQQEYLIQILDSIVNE